MRIWCEQHRRDRPLSMSSPMCDIPCRRDLAFGRLTAPFRLVSALERVQVPDRIKPPFKAAYRTRNGCPRTRPIWTGPEARPTPSHVFAIECRPCDIFGLTSDDALLCRKITRPAASPVFFSGARSAIGHSDLTQHQALRRRDRITCQVEWTKSDLAGVEKIPPSIDCRPVGSGTGH